MPYDGTTSYPGNNNFLIQISAGEVSDSHYSRIYLTSTFIHEAFHIMLWQRPLETFGSAVIDGWPNPSAIWT